MAHCLRSLSADPIVGGTSGSLQPVKRAGRLAVKGVEHGSHAAPLPERYPVVGQNQYTPIGFKTPSDNIFCRFTERSDNYPGSLRCDSKVSYAPMPPKPADCEFEWGNVEVQQGAPSGQTVCASDTAIDEALPALAYGNYWSRDSIKCKSESIGVDLYQRTWTWLFRVKRCTTNVLTERIYPI